LVGLFAGKTAGLKAASTDYPKADGINYPVRQVARIVQNSQLQTLGRGYKKLFKNLNDRLSCNNFGLGGLAVVLDEFNRRAMAVVMSSF